MSSPRRADTIVIFQEEKLTYNKDNIIHLYSILSSMSCKTKAEEEKEKVPLFSGFAKNVREKFLKWIKLLHLNSSKITASNEFIHLQRDLVAKIQNLTKISTYFTGLIRADILKLIVDDIDNNGKHLLSLIPAEELDEFIDILTTAHSTFLQYPNFKLDTVMKTEFPSATNTNHAIAIPETEHYHEVCKNLTMNADLACEKMDFKTAIQFYKELISEYNKITYRPLQYEFKSDFDETKNQLHAAAESLLTILVDKEAITEATDYFESEIAEFCEMDTQYQKNNHEHLWSVFIDFYNRALSKHVEHLLENNHFIVAIDMLKSKINDFNNSRSNFYKNYNGNILLEIKRHLVLAYKGLGIYLCQNEKPKESVEQFKSAIELFNTDEKDYIDTHQTELKDLKYKLAIAYNHIASKNLDNNDLVEAIKYSEFSIVTLCQIPDQYKCEAFLLLQDYRRSHAHILNQHAFKYIYEYNFKEAIECYKSAISLMKKIPYELMRFEDKTLLELEYNLKIVTLCEQENFYEAVSMLINDIKGNDQVIACIREVQLHALWKAWNSYITHHNTRGLYGSSIRESVLGIKAFIELPDHLKNNANMACMKENAAYTWGMYSIFISHNNIDDEGLLKQAIVYCQYGIKLLNEIDSQLIAGKEVKLADFRNILSLLYNNYGKYHLDHARTVENSSAKERFINESINNFVSAINHVEIFTNSNSESYRNKLGEFQLNLAQAYILYGKYYSNGNINKAIECFTQARDTLVQLPAYHKNKPSNQNTFKWISNKISNLILIQSNFSLQNSNQETAEVNSLLMEPVTKKAKLG